MRKLITGLSTFVTSLFVFAVPAFAYSIDYTPYGTSDAAAAGFLGIGTAVWLICACCVPLIIGGVLAYVVYMDAQKNKVENAALWAVLTFFFNLLGILIYFLAIRPDAVRKMEGGSHKPAKTEERGE